jgi:hypothetical protein
MTTASREADSHAGRLEPERITSDELERVVRFFRILLEWDQRRAAVASSAERERCAEDTDADPITEPARLSPHVP